MARRIIHMGEIGSGQATKAVNQIMAAGINEAVTEALAFGEAQGLDMAKVIAAVSGGAANNWFLENRGATMIQGQFNPGFKVALHYKDLQLCKAMAKSLGFSLSTAERVLANYQRLIEAGFGEEDISALYRLKRPR
jgi:3-hydroxyisobutyrate dehydrogenase